MLEGSTPLATLEALEQVPVGVVRDSVWQERVNSAPVRLTLATFVDTREALIALRDGQVRALISDPLTALYEARRLGMHEQLLTTGQVPIEAQLAFAIRSDWPQLKILLDRALDGISAEDEQKLRARWLPDLESPVEPTGANSGPELPSSNLAQIQASLSALDEAANAPRAVLEQARGLNLQADALLQTLAALQSEAATPVPPDVDVAQDELQQFLLWRTRLPERATAVEMERLLAAERAALLSVEQGLAQAALQLDDVRLRLAELPAALQQSRLDVLALSAQEGTASAGSEAALLASAQRRLVLTQQASLQAESQVLPQRETRLENQTRRLRQQLNMARQRVAALVTLQRDRAVREAQTRLADMQARAEQAIGAARSVAEDNLQLAQNLVELAQRYAAAIPEAERQAQIRERVAQSLKLTRERLSIDTHSAGLGQLLMAEQRLLESPRQPRRQLAEVLRELGGLRLAQIELDNRRDALSDGTAARTDSDLDDEQELADASLTRLDHQYAQRLLLDELQALTQRLKATLDATAADLGARIRDSDALKILIDERLLWLPTQPSVSWSWLKQLPQGFGDLLRPQRWMYTGALLQRSMAEHSGRWTLACAALLGLWWLRRQVPGRLALLARRTREIPTRGMALTAQALLLSLLAAAFWPGVLALLGEVLQRLAQPARFSDSLGLSLQVLAVQLYSLSALFWLTRPHGLTEAHFQWPHARSNALHRFAKRLLLIAPPLMLLGILEHHRGTELGSSTVGRLALILLVLVLARMVWIAMAPGAVLSLCPRQQGSVEPQRRVALWRKTVHVLLPGFLVSLAVLLLAGYGPIAYVLLRALVQTLMLVFAVMVCHQLALRWLLLQERRLAELRYQKAREARAQEQQARNSSDAPPALEPELVTLDNIACQTRRLLRALLWTGFAVGLLWVWSELLPALKVLDGFALWSISVTEGEVLSQQAITLRSILLSLLCFALTFIASRNLPGLLEVGLLERFPVDAATRYAITSVSRYIIVITGLVIGIGLLGLRWGHLQWLAAALTVGLGFGLQEIFANFVSGLILLFERPFRVGDTITIGTLSGTVTRIRTRATTILDWDNKEIVVPNKTFITGDLTNWTLSDEITRVTIAVGVAYETDPQRVHQVLREVAEAHPLVLKDPKPSTWMLRFGPSSMDFELRVHVGHIRDRLPVTSDLNASVKRRFAQERIEIPFPQVEMRQRGAPPVADRDPDQGEAGG
jgi:potassium efflux system protein